MLNTMSRFNTTTTNEVVYMGMTSDDDLLVRFGHGCTEHDLRSSSY